MGGWITFIFTFIFFGDFCIIYRVIPSLLSAPGVASVLKQTHMMKVQILLKFSQVKKIDCVCI